MGVENGQLDQTLDGQRWQEAACKHGCHPAQLRIRGSHWPLIAHSHSTVVARVSTVSTWIVGRMKLRAGSWRFCSLSYWSDGSELISWWLWKSLRLCPAPGHGVRGTSMWNTYTDADRWYEGVPQRSILRLGGRFGRKNLGSGGVWLHQDSAYLK